VHGVTCGVTNRLVGSVPSRASAGPSAQSASAVSLKQDMRKLWTDHVVWTRDYIIATFGDQPDANAAANRLMKNQEDIGNAVAKFYGAPVSARFNKDWEADVRAFDEVYEHILHMAAALSDGIVKQFANKFA
jgi:hypothetical protein